MAKNKINSIATKRVREISLTFFVVLVFGLSKSSQCQLYYSPSPIEQFNSIAVTDTTDIYSVQNHSAKAALWKSAIIPGWGQVYNKQAWKVGIIYGGAAAVTYFAIDNYRNAQKFKTEYINRSNGNTTDLLPEYSRYPDQNIYNLYQAYEKNFQLSIIAGVAVYALNLIDAYVYGHLFYFEINEDLSMLVTPSVTPTFNSFASGLTMKINF